MELTVSLELYYCSSTPGKKKKGKTKEKRNEGGVLDPGLNLVRECCVYFVIY